MRFFSSSFATRAEPCLPPPEAEEAELAVEFALVAGVDRPRDAEAPLLLKLGGGC